MARTRFCASGVSRIAGEQASRRTPNYQTMPDYKKSYTRFRANAAAITPNASRERLAGSGT